MLRGLYGALILGAGRPRPEDLIALNEQRATGDFTDEAKFRGRLRSAVANVVAWQRETGIDLVNDGEFGPFTDPDGFEWEAVAA